MRDNKISLLLLASFLLLLASFLVLCTWGYNFYTKVEKVSDKLTPHVIEEKNPNASRDSLINIFTKTVQQFDEKLSTTANQGDSLERDLQFKLDEYYRVKNELAHLLKYPASDLNNKATKEKITELQQKIRELQTTNLNVSEENKRLYALLEQINNQTVSSPVQQQPGNPIPARNVKFNEPKTDEVAGTGSVNVADLDLSGIHDDADGTELSGLLGTFIFRNTSSNNNVELMIVVIQPNGQVVQKSAWESGMFNSRDGKKIYSCKMLLENSKNETRRLSFSINTDKYPRGTYTVQVYYKGQSIARLSKTIS